MLPMVELKECLILGIQSSVFSLVLFGFSFANDVRINCTSVFITDFSNTRF